MNPLAEPLDSYPAWPEESLSFLLAYLDLLNASREARDLQRNPRDNPVSFRRLDGLGIGSEVLLWIVYQAHADHLSPASGSSNGPTGWHLEESVLLNDTSYFALTPTGEQFAQSFLAQVVMPENQREFDTAWDRMRMGRLAPRYDWQVRLFTWGCHVLKTFRQPANNQELILRAAEVLSWPTWFDDPLSYRDRRNAKVRLHDTIKDLNRRQKLYLVHFKGDGTGTRIGWELR